MKRYVALWLSGVCFAVFLFQALFGTDLVILDRSLVVSQPWRILTSIFAHGGIVHLLKNVFSLLLFGLILEGRVGPRRVFWLFLGSGIFVNLLPFYSRSLGASGAIFSLIGALVVLRPRMVFWMNGLPLPLVFVGVFYGIQDILGSFVPDSGVGHLAHLGGLGVGLAAGFLWRRKGLGDPFFFWKKRDQSIEAQADAIVAWHDRNL